MSGCISDVRKVCVFQQVNGPKLALLEVFSNRSYREGVLVDGVQSG